MVLVCGHKTLCGSQVIGQANPQLPLVDSRVAAKCVQPVM